MTWSTWDFCKKVFMQFEHLLSRTFSFYSMTSELLLLLLLSDSQLLLLYILLLFLYFYMYIGAYMLISFTHLLSHWISVFFLCLMT